MTVRPVLRVQPGRDTVTPEGDHLRVTLHRNGNPTLDAALRDPRTVIRLGTLEAPIEDVDTTSFAVLGGPVYAYHHEISTLLKHPEAR